MNKLTVNQCRLDVERIRKAADRIDELERAYTDAMTDRAIAIQSLKIIATWASASVFSFNMVEREIGRIHDKAMDTLHLIGGAK